MSEPTAASGQDGQRGTYRPRSPGGGAPRAGQAVTRVPDTDYELRPGVWGCTVEFRDGHRLGVPASDIDWSHRNDWPEDEDGAAEDPS